MTPANHTCTVKPNFLVIGCQRCGTTWLHQQFLNHPQIYVPAKQKEVKFFDLNFEKGIDWYLKNFFGKVIPETHIAVGESTTNYVESRAALQRIKTTLDSNIRIILIVRDPIDRLISEYKYNIKNYGESVPLADFIRNKDVINRSLYSNKITAITKRFGKDNCLILIFEEMMADKNNALSSVGAFLGVNNQLWTRAAVDKKINSSEIPAFHTIFIITRQLGKLLRKIGLNSIVERVKSNSIMNIFYSNSKSTNVDATEIKAIRAYFTKDVIQVRKFLRKPVWPEY